MVEKLQVYKDTYKLTKLLYKAMPQMEKYHRHIIGARMLEAALNLFKWVSLANQTRDKEERIKNLNSYMIEFEELKNLLRICNDFKLLKLSTITNIHIDMQAISKQINGWKIATSRMGLQSESQRENIN